MEVAAREIAEVETVEVMEVSISVTGFRSSFLVSWLILVPRSSDGNIEVIMVVL